MTAVARRPIRIAVVGAVLGWSAALAAAAPAPALEYVSAQVVGGQNAQGGTDVMCPNGQHVTGGGVFSNTGYDQTTVNDSVPIDDADADSRPEYWIGYGEADGLAHIPARVHVICVKKEKKLRYRFADIPVGPTSQARARPLTAVTTSASPGSARQPCRA
jgi:hypothetical protein